MASGAPLLGEAEEGAIDRILAVHINREGQALVVHCTNLAGQTVGASRICGLDDTVADLKHKIRREVRDALGENAMSLAIYNDSVELPEDALFASFTVLTAKAFRREAVAVVIFDKVVQEWYSFAVSFIMACLGLFAAVVWTRATYRDDTEAEDDDVGLGMLSLFIFYTGGLIGSFTASTTRVATATLWSCFVLSTLVKAGIVYFANRGGPGFAIWCLIWGCVFFGFGAPCVIEGTESAERHGSSHCLQMCPKFWLTVAVVLQGFACFNCTVVHSQGMEIAIAASSFTIISPFVAYAAWHMRHHLYVAAHAAHATLQQWRWTRRCPRTMCLIFTIFASATIVTATSVALSQASKDFHLWEGKIS